MCPHPPSFIPFAGSCTKLQFAEIVATATRSPQARRSLVGLPPLGLSPFHLSTVDVRCSDFLR
jgi:hypothetical protein